jgi:ADP-heptose:LPS heptosyltransferase
MRTWVDGVPQRIVVFRATMLSDLLCAVPALRALRAGFEGAEITLVGQPWARGLAQRLAHVDDFMPFPGHPGLPEVECDVRALPDFLAQVQARRFDLALQLHGSSDLVNSLVASFGARQNAGFTTADGWVPPDDPELFCQWPDSGHEVERLLPLTDHLGVARCGSHLEFPLHDDDRAALQALWPDAGSGRPYACVHAGAELPSRRWDPRRFAAVADVLAERGFTVVLTGSAAEGGLAGDVAACMQHTPLNLCGHTTLWTLGALIEGAELVVCNDSGVSHIAAALRRPSVVISCGADAARWSPLDRVRHRVLAQALPCRPCTHADCPTAHECASAIEVPQVLHWLPACAPQRDSVTA